MVSKRGPWLDRIWRAIRRYVCWDSGPYPLQGDGAGDRSAIHTYQTPKSSPPLAEDPRFQYVEQRLQEIEAAISRLPPMSVRRRVLEGQRWFYATVHKAARKAERLRTMPPRARNAFISIECMGDHRMNQHTLRTKLTDLWREFSGLTRDDPLFQKKRMYLFGQIIFYTKILAVVRRGKRFYSPRPNTRTQTEVLR